MLNIKKGTFAIIIIICLLLGAAALPLASGINPVDIVSGKSVLVSKNTFDEYKYLDRTYGKMDALKEYIHTYYYKEVDDAALMESAYAGLFDGIGDIYSYYITEEEYEDFLINNTGDYCGIGVTLTYNDKGQIYAQSVYMDSPADKAGMKTGDIILSVDGESYSWELLDDCAAAVRGDKGTSVNISVLRGQYQYDYTVVRDRILIESVESEMLEGDIAYIHIDSFIENTYEDFSAALAKLTNEGAKSLIIDMRDNGGGIVDEAIGVADELMNKGVVVYYEDHAGNREYYTTKDGRTELPYVILVNGNTASACEILSAGVQDNDEGLIVGTVSYGKGIIQVTRTLLDGSAVKLTEYQYFSPSGKEIHKVGITPDFIVELDKDCYDENGELVNDLQLQKAIELLTEQEETE